MNDFKRHSIILAAAYLKFFEENEIFVNRRQTTKPLLYRLKIAFSAEKDMSPKKICSDSWLTEYNNMQFFQLFRVQKKSVDILMGLIAPLDHKNILNKNYTGGHYPIDFQSQVLIFLSYMGSQNTLLGVGTQFKTSAPSVMAIVNRMLYFVVRLKTKIVKWPSTEAELQAVSDGFHRYPGTVGACDGTHVKVTVEREQQDSYIDRYRTHSINLMLICTAERLITYYFIGFPGSAHDSRVLENSTFMRTIQTSGANQFFHDDRHFHLLGDSAFPLKTWMMTPYRDNGNLTRAQKFHNKRLSSDRVVAEHTNALVKLRWARLKHIHTYNISKSVEIASAACVLHNFCLLNKDYWPEEEFLVRRVIEDVADRPEIHARAKRDAIKDRLFQERIANVHL